MIAVGIDIGKGQHAVAVLDENGKQLVKTRFYKNTREDAESLLSTLAQLAAPSMTHIGMESTGSYWIAFHDFLAKAGCRVDVINPLVTSASMAGDIRGRKSDKQDAVKIAGVMLSGDYTLRRAEGSAERKLKVLTRQRSFHVQSRSNGKLHLKSLLAEAFAEFEGLFDNIYASFPMALLEKYPTAAHLAKARPSTVAKIAREHTRGKDVNEESRRLIESARASLCVESELSEEVGEAVRATIRAISDCDARIGELDALISDCEAPKAAQIFMQIKGAGKILPKIVAAEFGDLERFATDPKTGSSKGMHKRMLAFAGAEPRLRESGKWRGRDKMSKRGSGQLRTALYQMAFTIAINDAYFKSIYEDNVKNKHKHHFVAVFYVVAKLLEVVCSLYKSGRQYTVEKPNAEVINTSKEAS